MTQSLTDLTIRKMSEPVRSLSRYDPPDKNLSTKAELLEFHVC